MNEPPFDPNAASATADGSIESTLAEEPAFDDFTEPAPVEPAPAPPGGSARRSNRVAVGGLMALIVALAFGGGLAVGRATAPAGDGTAAVPVATVDPSALVPTPIASAPPALESEGNRLGSANAKVVIDYWADYQCPFCAKFVQETIPQLEPLIADGTVALVHHDYAFLGPESTAAAIAVRCAGREGKYWPMHDAVNAAQGGENQGAFARARLLEVGASIGLDPETLNACMDDRSVMVEVLDDMAAGFRTGIESTPTIDVNGNRFTGVPDMSRLTAAIDAAVAGATPAPLPTAKPATDPWSGTATSGREAGDAAAPVTVQLWMDYQSTDSAAVAEDLGPELRTRVAEGKVRLELRDLAQLGDQSVIAGQAVRCTAAQGGPAWFVNDILSVSAQGADAGIYTADNIVRLASQLGLDVKAMDACLVDTALARAVTDETATGQTIGLEAGPSIVVLKGGKEVARFSGVLDVAKVLAAIDGGG